MPKSISEFLSAKTQKLKRAISPSRHKDQPAQPLAGPSQGPPSPTPSSVSMAITSPHDPNSGGQATASTQGLVTPANISSQNIQSAQVLQPPAGLSQSLTRSTTHVVPPAISVSLHPNLGGQASTISQGSVAPSNRSFAPDPALKDAIEGYNARLSDNDKAAFLSAGNIMDKLRAMDEENAQSSLSRSFGARIGKVLQFIKRFVGSVAICIQHHPDISSLVVGGFNCVLLLVLGYIEFFGSLTNMMERIGEHLHYLSEYGSLVFQGSPDVQYALKNAYCDLLDFFVAVRSVFTDKEGRNSYLRSFKLFMKLTWEPFESRFKPIQDRFFDHTLIVVRSAGVQDLITKYESLRQKGLEFKAEKRRQVLQWLSPIDFEETHQMHFKKLFKNTGQWLLDHPYFATWKDILESTLLWCYGMPGTGKTVLASLVVERLSAQYILSSNTGISFVYCNYKEPQKTATYIRTAIKQLSRKMSELPAELETLYDKHYLNASDPSCAELQEVFVGISKYFDKVFLVLDALDECTLDQRPELLEFLHGIVSPTNTTHGNIKLFVTSRKELDIDRAFKMFPIIEIEAKKVDVDIESYVTAQLEQYLWDGTLTLRDPSLKQRILRALVSRAGGMFLWVEFQLKHICSQTSDHGIEDALECLPEDLEQTYERIVHLINNKPKPQRKLARRVLMWIAYAERPLLLGELACAVAMEDDTKGSKMLKSMVPTVEKIFGVCANLIVLGSHHTQAFFSFEREVRFVHFSVQEFLLGKSLRPDSFSAMSALNIGHDIAHAEIARLCITFLLFCGKFGKFGSKYTGLFSYAEPFWKDHVRALTGISTDLMPLILLYFESGAFLEQPGDSSGGGKISSFTCVRESHTEFSPYTTALIFDLPLVLEHLEKEKHDQLHCPEGSYALHYAVRQNSYTAVERLCHQGFDVNQLDSRGHLPLYYATSKQLAQLLVDNGADVNGHDEHFGSLLQAASAHSKVEVVHLLLERGADVNAEGGQYGNALHAATCMKNITVVELLLDRGASVDVQDEHFGKVLVAAAGGKVKTMQMLLESGPDVKELGVDGQALTVAVKNGRMEIVQLLLDKGADVNAWGGAWGDAGLWSESLNALGTAVMSGTIEMVQFLLNRGADVNANFRGDRSALKAAVYTGRIEMVHLLLDKGARVDAMGGCGHVLEVAAIRNTTEVVRLLLDRGADVNAKGNEGGALVAAMIHGKVEVARLLLDRGADVNAKGGMSKNALEAAVKLGKIEMVRLLLDRGANVNGECRGALQAAASGGDVEMVRLLLDRGVDLDATGEETGSALEAAAYKGKIEIVKLLLDKGADVNVEGGRYGSVLQAAAYKGKIEIVKLLLEKGADVNVKGGGYGSALQAAAHKGKREEVVRLLLEKGADVNATGGEYGSALQACAASFHATTDMVQLLLDEGADVNAKGGEFGSPLQAAVHGSSIEVVRLLLDSGADVNAGGGEYGCALGAALEGEHTKAVRLLLEGRADVNAGGEYGSALQAYTASYHATANGVQLLLDRGADVNAKGGEYGSPLQAAAANSNIRVAKLLLEKGADVNTEGGKYGSALQAYIASDHATANGAQLLLDRGADVNAKGGEYGSSLQAAAAQGNIRVVKLLLEKGADVNAEGGEYGSALQAYTTSFHSTTNRARFLLDRGADVNAKGGKYGSPLQVAAQQGNRGVVKLLLDGGADVNAKGGEYGSALQAATKNHHYGVIKLLQEYGGTE